MVYITFNRVVRDAKIIQVSITIYGIIIDATSTIGSICFFLISVKFNNKKNQENELNIIIII